MPPGPAEHAACNRADPPDRVRALSPLHATRILCTQAALLGTHPAITTSHTYKELPFFVSPWHEHHGMPILLNRQFKNTVGLLNRNLTHYSMGFGAGGVDDDSSNRAALDYICMTRDVSLCCAGLLARASKPGLATPLRGWPPVTRCAGNDGTACVAQSWVAMPTVCTHMMQAFGQRPDSQLPTSKVTLGRPDTVVKAVVGDHTIHNVYGNSTVLHNIRSFAGPSLRVVLILCEPAHRALTSYRFMHFEHGLLYDAREGVKQGLFDTQVTFEQVVAAQLSSIPRALRSPAPWVYEDVRATRGGEQLALDELDEFGFQTIVRQGLFALAISRWLKIYPRKSLHVVTREHLARDPLAVMRSIEAFLGVPQANWPAAEAAFERRNSNSDGGDLQIDPAAWANLTKFFAPHNMWLEQLLGQRFPEWENPRGPGANTRTKPS